MKLLVWIGVLCGGAAMASAQAVMSHNNDVWLHLFCKNRLSDRWSLSVEATQRYAQGVDQKQQYFIRPSVDYQVNVQLMLSGGYSHYVTYVYGDPAINKTDIPENHYWGQLTYVQQWGGLKLTHRLRDENRFVGVAAKIPGTNDYSIDYYDYRNRLRYQFLFNYPLYKQDGQARLTGIVGDEAFINLGAHAGATLMNQNRAIVGMGFQVDAHQQIQLCYIHQNIWNYPNTIIENNPTLRLSYVLNLDWRHKSQ